MAEADAHIKPGSWAGSWVGYCSACDGEMIRSRVEDAVKRYPGQPLLCGSCRDAERESELRARIAELEAELAAEREKFERYLAFTAKDAPEYEKANCTLKHQARELEAEVERLTERELRIAGAVDLLVQREDLADVDVPGTVESTLAQQEELIERLSRRPDLSPDAAGRVSAAAMSYWTGGGKRDLYEDQKRILAALRTAAQQEGR